MFISTENEQISLPSLISNQSLRSSAMEEPNPDSTDCSHIPTVFTDVSIVPEHEKTKLSNLEAQIEELRLKHRKWSDKRREALNKILDIKGSIRVFCRVRPFLDVHGRRAREPISTRAEKVVVMSGGTRKDFEFDKAFPQEVSQGEVFHEVEPILRSAVDGHNVCILAYGQTGTGKTFTMDGTNEQQGIIPRALKELFVRASSEGELLTFSMSMLEVYMGNLRDLLAPRPASRAYEPVTRCNLNIQTDPKGGVEIEGLTEVEILDSAKARWWYSRGRRARSTSWTNVNETSSRSHCLTRITIFRQGNGSEANKTKTVVSKLWMVDLGGSERLLKTGAIGLTLDEGRSINLSLSALGDVIAALRRKRGHVPYRNSKLTQILKDSLGDGSKVLMLVHVSPSEEDVGETICSLCFAKRARAVESNRDQAEDLKRQKEKRVLELAEYMREAEEECERVRDRIRKAELLAAENKRLNSDADRPPGHEENECITPSQVSKEAVQRQSEKERRRSLPRFMTSTVASRVRQTASEKEISGRASSALLVRSVARSSVQFAASQSISFSDRRFKVALLSSGSRKSKQRVETRLAEAEIFKPESPRRDGLVALPRSKVVASSNDTNLRPMISRHRRRMSDLI